MTEQKNLTLRKVVASNMLDHPSATLPSMVEFGSSCEDDVADVYAMVERIIADERLHVALATPPADDVRELTDHLNGLMDSLDDSVTHDQIYEQLQVAWNMARAFRPRETVAEDAREAEMRELHHFEVEQQLVETIAIVKRAQAAVLRHEHTPASLHMDAILDEVNTEIPSGAEVRPRGTVTDAEAERAAILADLREWSRPLGHSPEEDTLRLVIARIEARS